MPANPSWHFAPNDGGIDVVRDPSSTHFGGSPLANAVREVIQNSLDAREDGLDAVRVTFTEMHVPPEAIGAEGLRPHVEQCMLRASAEGRSPIQASFKMALDTLSQDRIRCLKIHDTGTTGLRKANWDALVLQEGAVEKQTKDTAPGGSYGIGKNAVLNISDLMAVFYSTRYVEGRRGRVQKLQGKATLMTHPNPDLPLSHSVQHVGFYRNADREPMIGTRGIPEIFQLQETGTGIYVIGFNPHSEDWLTETRVAVVTNFFYAIHQERLEVVVKGESGEEFSIEQQALDTEFEAYAPESAAHHYYRAISGQAQPLETTLDAPEPLGPLKVYLLAGTGPRRTAYVNHNGMLVTDSRDQHINPLAPRGRGLWPDYTAVVTPATKNGATFLLKLENPSHNVLSTKRLPQERGQKLAGNALRAARGSIRNYIDATVSIQQGKVQTNITELSHRFPELEYLFDQSLPSRVVPNDEVVATLDEPPGETNRASSTANNDQQMKPTIGRPRIIPINQCEAVLAFDLTNESRQNVQLTLKPAGEEPMSQNLIFVQTADVLTPPEMKATAIDGEIHLNQPPDGRMTVRVVTSVDLERIAVHMEAH